MINELYKTNEEILVVIAITQDNYYIKYVPNTKNNYHVTAARKIANIIFNEDIRLNDATWPYEFNDRNIPVIELCINTAIQPMYFIPKLNNLNNYQKEKLLEIYNELKLYNNIQTGINEDILNEIKGNKEYVTKNR